MLGRIALRALPQMGLMQAPSGVVIVDTELRIAWTNQAAGRLADGIPATAWPGRRLGEVLPQIDAASIEQSLPRHSTVVLYTDGLIEKPAGDISTGLTCLATTLSSLTALPVNQACDILLDTLAPSPADDIAILMART